MLSKVFSSKDPSIEALEISSELKSFIYFLKKYGATGASTLALQSEHYGNISRAIFKLEAVGVRIKTVKRNIIDKRGNTRRGIAHRIYMGIDTNINEI